MSAKVQQVDRMVVEPGLFTSNWHNLVFAVTQACIQLFFYGIYLNLFVLAVYTLGRRKVAKRKILLLHMWILTAFGTTQVILCLVGTATLFRSVDEFVEQGTTLHVMKLQASVKSLQTAQHFLFVSNRWLYRCYVVWGSQWKVIIFPGLLIVGSFVSGCLIISPRFGTSSMEIQRVPYILAAVTNLVLVAFTAGRIWWIRRDAVYICADNIVLNHYNTIIAMILESSALHAILTTGKAITYSSAHNYPAGISFWAIQAISRTFYCHDVQDAVDGQASGSNPKVKQAALTSKSSHFARRQFDIIGL
ncbi:hypothetical protein C8F04DRAFT_1136314 [Mycena alexandri]|uniref:Uncharacterized protein n=1 Tax=Mycena alexandri TaxID=1745969 RepID=A0AAD6S842_9AGAR|nr:hypothetical protein C8F04DRAFT_1136314 [Mycena alexandri]